MGSGGRASKGKKGMSAAELTRRRKESLGSLADNGYSSISEAKADMRESWQADAVYTNGWVRYNPSASPAEQRSTAKTVGRIHTGRDAQSISEKAQVKTTKAEKRSEALKEKVRVRRADRQSRMKTKRKQKSKILTQSQYDKAMVPKRAKASKKAGTDAESVFMKRFKGG